MSALPAGRASTTITLADQSVEVSQDRLDDVAKAASAGLMAHVNIESAVVNICGSGSDLMFSLICVVVDPDRAAEVMDMVSHSMVPQVEKVLNMEFVSRHMEFMCGGAVLDSGASEVGPEKPIRKFA